MLLERKLEETCLLGLKAISVFLHISKSTSIQECSMIFPDRSNFGLNFHPTPLRSLKKTQQQYAHVEFPIKCEQPHHCDQGMRLPSESNY